MAEFTLPKNSKIQPGRTFPAKAGATRVRRFKVYRWNPDDGRNPSVDTYEVDLEVKDVAHLSRIVSSLRASEAVVQYCADQQIGFIPWYPLAAGDLAREGSVLDKIAKSKAAAPAQVALAWVLKRSPVMLPIPGTGKVKHLEENVQAAAIEVERRPGQHRQRQEPARQLGPLRPAAQHAEGDDPTPSGRPPRRVPRLDGPREGEQGADPEARQQRVIRGVMPQREQVRV